MVHKEHWEKKKEHWKKEESKEVVSLCVLTLRTGQSAGGGGFGRERREGWGGGELSTLS